MGDIGRAALQRAWLDLEWRFGECEAVLGLHGMPLERNGNRPWDEAREEQAHRARRRPEHRRDVQRMRRVDAALGGIPGPDRRVVALACAPLQLPWQDDLREAQLREAFKREGTSLSTLAVVLDGPEVREAWGGRFMAGEAEVWPVPSKDNLLRFLENEAHHGMVKNKKGKSVQKAANAPLLRRLHQAAEARIQVAVMAYALAGAEFARANRARLERLEDGHVVA
jgi:hypothetical protein